MVASSDDVDRYLAAVRVSCDQLRAELRHLQAALDSDGALTDLQLYQLATGLASVDQVANAILLHDARVDA